MTVDKPVTVTLSPETLNAIVAGLEGLPYRVAHPALTELHAEVWRVVSATAQEVKPSGAT